jgi:hypothetical protein
LHLFLELDSSSEFVQFSDGFLMLRDFCLQLLHLENLVADNTRLVDDFHLVVVPLLFELATSQIQCFDLSVLLFTLTLENDIFVSDFLQP